MSNPPGQEPRPGFTPRADQGRPGRRGDSGRSDGGYRRDDSARRPAQGASGAGASGRGAGGGSRDTSRDDDDYWTGGRQSGTRPSASGRSRRDPDYRDGREEPARRPDDRYRNAGPAGRPRQDGRDRGDRGAGGAAGRRAFRDGYRDEYDDAQNAAGRGSGVPTFVSRKTPPAAARPGPGPFSAPGLRWVGTWRERRAVLVLSLAGLIGLIGTIVIGHDPGFLIGALLVLGTVAAAIGARRRAVHKLIPLPSLYYLVMVTAAGTVNDWRNLNDSKEFVTSFLTWIGGGFFGLAVATVLVVLITFIRWLGSKLLVSGQLPDTPSGPGRTVPSTAGRDPWAGRAARGDGPRRDGTSPDDRGPRGRTSRDRAPSGNAFGDSRAPRARDDDALRDDRVPRPDRAPRGGRAPGDPRDRDGAVTWGGGDPGDDRVDPRPPRDARGQRPGQKQRRGDSWDGDPHDGARRPRPTDSGPRDLW